MTMLRSTLLALLLSSGLAEASVPGWAELRTATRVDVSHCAAQAKMSLMQVTGKAPTEIRLDDQTFIYHGFTADEGIFVECSASARRLCETGRYANLHVVVFSSNGSAQAMTVRDQMQAAFGKPESSCM